MKEMRTTVTNPGMVKKDFFNMIPLVMHFIKIKLYDFRDINLKKHENSFMKLFLNSHGEACLAWSLKKLLVLKNIFTIYFVCNSLLCYALLEFLKPNWRYDES